MGAYSDHETNDSPNNNSGLDHQIQYHSNKEPDLVSMGPKNDLNQQFDIFLNLTPSAIFAVDTDRKITKWNKRAEEITGFTSEEIMGKECFIFANSPCLSHCGLFDDSTPKPIFGKECIISTKHGKTRTILKNVNLLKDSKGEIIGGVESFEDITYQKKIENDLKQSEINFLSFFNTTDDFLFVITPDGQILRANQAAIQGLKYSEKELSEKKLIDLTPSHLHDTINLYVEELLHLRKRSCSIPLISRNGSIIPVETRATYGVWSQKPAIFIVSKDISELLMSEEKFAKAFDSNSAAMAISSIEEGFIDVNRSFIELSEYTKEEILGKKSDDLGFFQNPEERNLLLKKLLLEKKIEQIEITLRSKNNQVKTGVLSLDLIEIQSKQFILTVFNDLTAQINAQHETIKLLEDLKRSNANLEQFAYIASHDLQEPLRKILTFSERIKNKYSDTLDETGIDYLKRMFSAAERMQKMINDLLSYSRISTVKNPFSQVDLKDVLTDTISDLELLAEKVKARFDFDDLPVIDADLAQMRQLFSNLIGNSLKYSQDITPPIIQIQCDKTSDFITLRFIDNGIGFNEQYLELIFQPFQRLHGRIQYEGSGIGLAICKKIVERHKGNITAKSTPGIGSTFFVTLPVQQNY